MDDWDKYLATTGQSMLVIAPEPSTPDTPQEADDDTVTNVQGDIREEIGNINGPNVTSATGGALNTSSRLTADSSLLPGTSSPRIDTNSTSTVIGTITLDLNVPNTKETVSQCSSRVVTAADSRISTVSTCLSSTISVPASITTSSVTDQPRVSHLAASDGVSLGPTCNQASEGARSIDNNPSHNTTTGKEPGNLPPLNIPPGIIFLI